MNTKYHIDQNPHKGNRGLTRAWHAAKNSWSGMVYAFKEESAFRQELLLLCIFSPIALALPVRPLEKMVLIASLVLVLVVELLNSSVEAAIDRISFEHHDLSKRAKDYGSAAVMLALVIAMLFWAIVCIPLLFNL
ncbi:diacylglycerol kinase [Polynucleobacter sphagniphilus]|uniref:Diacylglycerol kinase n=1 Tax=Polynucleobacter sphagniphilus TaxID=1743169 RepID=A0AA43S7A6_9BURK|nr:diacylglycerol kinase [Polynucleobacter sphagniphilus]MDF9787162.1 diacylglycerol kinase (ATP) [Polynucleobacter sphagniphilus]MDH6154456.1 diacylglycerol kinase (ATP) [Polynucleobacter sphagniphilus]MDH6240739.1 diacylglycerol kinase (ATP) [Polynucleobacter sphagniphilus]MDH6249824.1 diacylglycerol kinase (ATP) [Polynucleobacter sphagniphilus]MDH6301009.1 diacylglycerol kinase (ATP) [Polynucleobacter sphagniphilus]